MQARSSMRANALIAAVGLLMIALAGCAEQAEPVQDDELPPGVGKELKATEDTGVIRGVVVDAAIVPIEGVTISLDEDTSTLTDANGFFGFEDLEPGGYFIEASKAGWQTIQSSTVVEAGVSNPPLVRISLALDPSSAPTVLARQFDGMIVCSVSIIAVGYSACDNDFLVEYHDEVKPTLPDHVQSEMLWKSTQALGDWMSFMYSTSGSGALLHNYVEDEGPSPLLLRANMTVLEENDVQGYSGGLQLRIFNSGIEGSDIGRDYGDPIDGDNCIERPVLGGCTKGIGATVDQSFVVYTHLFYNQVPDEDWQFSVHGEWK